MEPAWAQFESDYQKKIGIVYINVDERDTPEFRAYSQFLGQSIPTTVWLNAQGQPVENRVGVLKREELGSLSDKLVR